MTKRLHSKIQTETSALTSRACSDRNKRTSQRVLELLKARGAQCTAQLSDSLGMTEQGVRRHLLRLTEEGLITAHTEKPLGRGRPQRVYQLTEQGEARFPKSYPTLCIALLEQVELQFGTGAVGKILAGRAQTLTQQTAAKWPADLPLRERLQRLTAEFSAAGYNTVLEQGTDDETGTTFYMAHQNCPHLAVAQEFGEICQAEQTAIAELLEVEADPRRQLRCEGRIVTGDCCCRYRIQLAAEDKHL